MADFCFQCSLDMGFPPPGDLANLVPGAPFDSTFHTLCEGCGPTVVDMKGRCIYERCDCAGHLSPGDREALRRAEGWLAARSGPLGWAYRLRDRLLGTPWCPGLIHELRWRWFYLIDRLRHGKNYDQFQAFEGAPIHLNCRCVVIETGENDVSQQDASENESVHGGGNQRNAEERGPIIGDIPAGTEAQRMGPGESS